MSEGARTDASRQEALPITWQSTAVALGILAVLAAIEVTAVAKYGADDALKIWAALGPLVGVVTGAFVTYFFSRQAVDQAQQRVVQAERKAGETEDRARENAQAHQEELQQAREAALSIWRDLTQRLTTAQGAITNTVAELSPDDAATLRDATDALFAPPPAPPSP